MKMSGTASLNGNLRRQGTGSSEPQCPQWMYNEDNQNPCQVAAQVLKLCDSSISDSRIESSLLQNFSCPVKGNKKECCCSTTTYALLSACLTCQNNNTNDELSYRSFFDRAKCSGGSAPSPTFSAGLQPQVDAIEVPLWAMIPPTNLDGTWDINAAEHEADSEELSSTSSNSGTSTVVTATSPASSSSSSSAQPSSAPTISSTEESSSKKSPSRGTIAAAVLGSLALFCLLLCCAYFLRRYYRRLAKRPSTIPRMDLVDPGMEEKRASKPLDLLDGEDVERGESSSRPRSEFPFPFEWVVRRYHPNAPHSIEPSADGEGELEREREREREARRVPPPVPALPLTVQNTPLDFPSVPEPAPAITKPRKKDQLERDLAHLRGSEPTTSEDTSSSSAGKRKGKRRSRRKSFLDNINELGKQATVALTGGSHSGSGSRSAPSDRKVYSAHSERRAEGKYYHLPPSAQFLANVARFPQRIDPERPWEVKGT